MKIRTKVALTTAACLAALTVVFYFTGRLLISSDVSSIQAQFNEMPDFRNTINAALSDLAKRSIDAARDSRTIDFAQHAQKDTLAIPHGIPKPTARDGQVISDKQLDLFVIADSKGNLIAAAMKEKGEITEMHEGIFSYISPENDILLKNLSESKAHNIAGVIALQSKQNGFYNQYIVSVAPIFADGGTDNPTGLLIFGRQLESLPKIGNAITYFNKRDLRDRDLRDGPEGNPYKLYKPFADEVMFTRHDDGNAENGTGSSVVSIPLRDFYGFSYAQIEFTFQDATATIKKDSERMLTILVGGIALFFFIPIFLVNTHITNKAIRKLVKQTTGETMPFFSDWNAEDEIKKIASKIESAESQLKELREKHEVTEATLATLQITTPGTTLIYNDDGEIVHCHLSIGKPHASSLAKAIAVGKNVKDVKGLKADVFKREILAIDAASKHGGCHIIQFSANDDIGAIIWIEARIMRLGPNRILAHLDDITARKSAGLERTKLEEKIKEIEKAETFGILAGGMAHDYNNMLTAMLGNIDLLLDGELAVQTRDALSDIRSAMVRSASLVRRMLSYAGKSGPILEDTNLCGIVSDITRLMRRSIPDNAKIILNIPETTPVIRVDSTQIWQVLMNLIVNGCDSMEGAPGTVRISTSGQELSDRELSIYNSKKPLTPGWYACVEVEDTGKGMDDQTIAHIFEPFFTTKANGKGLGLPSVINIIFSYNGGITLRSTVGRGTVFKIVIPARLSRDGEVLLPERLKKKQEEKEKTGLPSVLKHDTQPLGGGTASLKEASPEDAIESDPETKKDETEPRRNNGKASILIVDDDPSIRRLLKLILKSGGYNVTDSSSGKEGLKTFETASPPFDLCVMDVSMGAGMSGLELCAEIRKRSPAVPLVLMSAYRAKEMSSKMAEAGVSGFLAKPFRGADVLDLVKKFVNDKPKQNEEGGANGTLS